MRRTHYGLVLVLVITAAASGQAPAVFDGGVVNAASFTAGQAVTPGSIVAIFGTDLAGQLAQASTIPLSTSLDGISVTFNNVQTPLFAVIPPPFPGQPQGPNNPAQINAQLPWNVLAEGQVQGVATIVVNRNGVTSTPVNVQVGPFSPGVFALPLTSGQLLAVAITLDGALAAPPGSVPGFPTRPARPGEVLQVLATGLGALDAPLQSGHDSSDKLRRTTTIPTVLFGGVPTVIGDDVGEFSGMAPTLVGVNQVNVMVPANSPKGNAVSLQIQIGGITSTAQATIAVE